MPKKPKQLYFSLACALAAVTVVWAMFAPKVCHADESKQAGWAGVLAGVRDGHSASMELGVTGGYTFPFGLFVGAEVSTNALGYKEGFLGKDFAARRVHGYLAQVGFDFVYKGTWVARPEFLMGIETVCNCRDGKIGDGSFYNVTDLALGFGFATLVRFGTFFAGPELRLMFAGPGEAYGDQVYIGGIRFRAIGGVAF